MADRRPSRRMLLGGMAAAAVTAGRVPSALAASLGGTATPAAATGSTSAVETRVAPPVAGEAGVLGETDLTTFDLIGLSAAGLSTTTGAQFRVLTAAGWSGWTDVHASHAVDVSEPVWVGDATGYEVRRITTGTTVDVHLVRDPNPRPAVHPNALLGGARENAGGDPTPPIILRSGWGARAAVSVQYEPTIRVGIIHHSVTANSYAPSDVPAILRSIQAYHMDVNGWWDIAYQFLIDNYGYMWEGRQGGIDESTFGAHSLSFNENTFGVCNIGDFSQANPTTAMLNANAELVAWKLKRYAIDPTATTTVQATNDDNEWYHVGDVATLPAVCGHSDTRPDECPGHLLKQWLPWMRTEARNRQYKYKVKPLPAQGSEGPIARNSDGRLEVFGIGVDHALHNIWQQPGSATGWSALNGLGGSLPAGSVSAISNQDGRLEVFMTGNDGLTYHSWQSPSEANGWSGYWSLSSRTGSAPGVARNLDGRLEVFGIDAGAELWHAWQVAPNSPWSEPAGLAQGMAGTPGVGATIDGRLVVWSVTADGRLAGISQASPGGGWGPVLTIPASVTGQPAVGRNADGRMEVFALGTDHRIYHAWQNGNGTSNPEVLANGTFSHAPTVGRNLDGRLEVFAVGTDGRLWHAFQVQPNSSWSDFSVLDGHTFTGPPSVTSNADGRLEVFVAGAGTVWHGWQVAPNSAWSGFIPLY